jgi:hypothetical protein
MGNCCNLDNTATPGGGDGYPTHGQDNAGPEITGI